MNPPMTPGVVNVFGLNYENSFMDKQGKFIQLRFDSENFGYSNISLEIFNQTNF